MMHKLTYILHRGFTRRTGCFEGVVTGADLRHSVLLRITSRYVCV
ncbi:Uncharacterised protein [Yersinia pseudotuberculosis]|nr:Uncharacterised protein [Yersinia pseudotuberculosis]